jgi:iron complex transport system substrate-binding protein
LADDRGREISLAKPASRIVSLAPHLTELLFAAGAGDKIAGVSRHSDYPQEAKKIPQVGDAYQVDSELMVALNPDLVVAWKSGNPRSEIVKLENLGFKVFVTEPAKLADISRLLKTFGLLAGTQAFAEQAAQDFDREVSRLQAGYASRQKVTVFYQIWERPLMTVNGRHMISDVIRLCGGENQFADLDVLSAQVSMESVLARDPQVVIDGSSLGKSDWRDWRRFPELAAVANGNLYHVSPDLLHRSSPRILEGAKRVCEVLEEARRK